VPSSKPGVSTLGEGSRAQMRSAVRVLSSPFRPFGGRDCTKLWEKERGVSLLGLGLGPSLCFVCSPLVYLLTPCRKRSGAGASATSLRIRSLPAGSHWASVTVLGTHHHAHHPYLFPSPPPPQSPRDRRATATTTANTPLTSPHSRAPNASTNFSCRTHVGNVGPFG
jgi:hypothetical protein